MRIKAEHLKDALAKGLISGDVPDLKPENKAEKKRSKIKSYGISEKDFQKQFVAFAQHHGWRVVVFEKVLIRRKNGTCYWATPFGADGKGFFDTFMVRGTKRLWPELKVKGGRIEPEQKLWHDAIRSTGDEVCVWYPEDWPEIEDKIING
jgi:hypothetical protein